MKLIAAAVLTACTTTPTTTQIDSPTTSTTVATEPCSKMASFGGATFFYAEHAYPGKTASDLASLVVEAHIIATNGYTLPGYTHQLGLPFLRDGFAAVTCGSTTTQIYDTVDFIGP